MYTLGSYLKTANNNALITQEMLTSDGRPKGALLMSIIVVRSWLPYTSFSNLFPLVLSSIQVPQVRCVPSGS